MSPFTVVLVVAMGLLIALIWVGSYAVSESERANDLQDRVTGIRAEHTADLFKITRKHRLDLSSLRDQINVERLAAQSLGHQLDELRAITLPAYEPSHVTKAETGRPTRDARGRFIKVTT